MRVTPENIQSLKPNEIFVFGSNGLGRHDGGAANIAFNKFGAIYGQSYGLQGRSFGINTMDTVSEMTTQINRFIEETECWYNMIFLVTEIGCGIAGYTPKEIAPLFKNAVDLENIYLPESFWKILNKNNN